MIELGDLVVFTPCQRNCARSELLLLASKVAFRKLREKVSCGVVIDRMSKDTETGVRVIFPEGSYNMDVSQVTTISKWYVASNNKL